MAGRVSFFISDFPPALGLIRQGKLKAVAVTTSTRNKDLPELPTIGETLPGYEAVGWQGILARSGTPKTVVSRLNGILTAYLKRPEAADRMRAIGMDVRFSTPEEFQDFIRSQLQQWKKIIADAGIKAE
jgi:tripartite-type tricarboxylate transporter receptor subunit TctC